MLVILLASFTIIFHRAALRHTLASPAKAAKQKSKALTVIPMQDAHNHQHYSIIHLLVHSIVSHIEGFFFLLLHCSTEDQMNCLCNRHTQPERPKSNLDVASFCRASCIPAGDKSESRCRIITIHESDLKLFLNGCTYKRQ